MQQRESMFTLRIEISSILQREGTKKMYISILYGHDNVEMDMTRRHVANSKNTHDMCVRHACRTCFGHDTTL